MSEMQVYLESRRVILIEAAQVVYDEWTQDANGWDEIYGEGGCCTAIADSFSDLIKYPCDEEGCDGDDHSWVVVTDEAETEIWGVDIPPQVYEYGCGYRWTKRPGVVFKPQDIQIWRIK